MIVVGLTGSLAAGKTTAAKIFKRLGCKVYDADLVARHLLSKGSNVYHKFLTIFGPAYLKADGSVDRLKVAQAVFSDPAKIKQINRLIHPAVIRELETVIKQNAKKNGLLILDTPLLFEAKASRLVEIVVVIKANRKKIHQRMKAKGISADLTEKILKAQWPTEKKEKLADFVVENNVSLRNLEKKIKEVFIAIRRQNI